MAVPKRKTSKSKRDMRRAHDSLTFINPLKCAECGGLRLRHFACADCDQKAKESKKKD